MSASQLGFPIIGTNKSLRISRSTTSEWKSTAKKINQKLIYVSISCLSRQTGNKAINRCSDLADSVIHATVGHRSEFLTRDDRWSVFYMSFQYPCVRQMVCCPDHNNYSLCKHEFIMDFMHAARKIHTIFIVLVSYILCLYDLFHILLSHYLNVDP